jgi:hypothetical protein
MCIGVSSPQVELYILLIIPAYIIYWKVKTIIVFIKLLPEADDTTPNPDFKNCRTERREYIWQIIDACVGIVITIFITWALTFTKPS